MVDVKLQRDFGRASFATWPSWRTAAADLGESERLSASEGSALDLGANPLGYTVQDV